MLPSPVQVIIVAVNPGSVQVSTNLLFPPSVSPLVVQALVERVSAWGW